VTGQGDEWHLHGQLHDQIASLMHSPDSRSEPMLATLRDLRPA
jgi:hypothetical protein